MPTSAADVVVGGQLGVGVEGGVAVEAGPARRGHGRQHRALQLAARVHLAHLLHGGVQVCAGGVLVAVLRGSGKRGREMSEMSSV